jgi:tetratricopeptide (TPR) repeat protein
VLLAALGIYVPATLYWSSIWQDDVDLYEHMVRTSPSSATPQLNLGGAYLDLGRYREARDPLEQAIRLNPNYGVAYTALGRIYEAEGKPEEAMILFRGGLAAAPSDFRTVEGLADALLRRGNTEEAVPLLERIVQSDPYFSPGQRALGVAYLKRGDRVRALAQFEQARNLLPEAIGLRYNLALLYTDLNRFPEAIRELEAALQIDPDYAPATRMLVAIDQHLRNGGAPPKVGQPRAESSPASGGR